MVGPTIPHIWNPYPAFPGRINHFYGCLYPGLGRPHEGFQDFGYLDPFRPQAPHQHFGAQRGNFGPPSLGFSLTGPPSYDLYRQHYCCSLYQQTGRPLPIPVTSSSGSVVMATTHGTGDRCSVTRLAGEVDVHFSIIPPAQQSHSETKDHPGGRSNTNSHLVAITTLVSTSTMSVCGPLFLPYR